MISECHDSPAVPGTVWLQVVISIQSPTSVEEAGTFYCFTWGRSIAVCGAMCG